MPLTAASGTAGRPPAPPPESRSPAAPRVVSPPHSVAPTTALAALALSACGGGGGATDSSTPNSGTAGSTAGGTPAAPLPAPSPAPSEAARFLLQAQFSASAAEIAAVQSQGYAAWLDQQLAAPAGQGGWDWLISKGYNGAGFTNASAPLDYMIWRQLITATDSVRKRFALALSEIFVVSANSMAVSFAPLAMAAYWDMLSGMALGNYRELLEALSLNPAMGVMLNTRGNQKENPATGREPDENYAREVMQLMSIGLYQLHPDGALQTDGNGQPVPTYSQSDIGNLARVFTGWNFDPTGNTASTPLQLKTPMRLSAALHSTLAATFLGVSIPANTDGTSALRIALDTLFNHPNVGPFIGRQLIERLICSNPSPAYIGRVAAAFADNGAGVRGDLKAVLLDGEARSADAAAAPGGGRLREPMLRFVHWARTFKAHSVSDAWQIGDLSSDATRLAQSALRSPSVFNFFRPGYVPPNTALAASGRVGPEFQITNETTVASYINFMQTTIQNGIADVLPDYGDELALAATPAALLNHLNLLLAAGQLSSATLATLVSAISTISVASAAGLANRVYAAILLVMAAPQYLVQK